MTRFKRPKVERIALAPQAQSVEQPEPKKIGFEEFLARRLKRPEGVPPVTLEDMERAIISGALDGNVSHPQHRPGSGGKRAAAIQKGNRTLAGCACPASHERRGDDESRGFAEAQALRKQT